MIAGKASCFASKAASDNSRVDAPRPYWEHKHGYQHNFHCQFLFECSDAIAYSGTCTSTRDMAVPPFTTQHTLLGREWRNMLNSCRTHPGNHMRGKKTGRTILIFHSCFHSEALPTQAIAEKAVQKVRKCNRTFPPFNIFTLSFNYRDELCSFVTGIACGLEHIEV